VANSPSAKKRAKQAEKRRSHNASLRSMVRTYIKAIDTKDAEKAQAAYVLAVPVIDRMADKGIIHKNKAARHKSRLNGHIKALSTAAAA
jgi:small subunit ribosomal protein S20